MAHYASRTFVAALLALVLGVLTPLTASAQREAEPCNNQGCGCGNPPPLVSKGYGPCGCFGNLFDAGCGCGVAKTSAGCCPGQTDYGCGCGVGLVNGCCPGRANVGCGCGVGKDANGCCPGLSNVGCGCGVSKNAQGCCPGQNDTGCGCGKPGPVCGRCGGKLTVCGDCSTTCCHAAYNNNPAISCLTYQGALAPSGNNTLVNAGPWIGYFKKKEPHCTRPNQPYICANIRCNHGACPAGNVGCFDPKSTILLEGGVFKSADEVKAGDRLYNSLTGRSAPVKRVITGPEKIPMVEMGYEGNLLRVTQDHPVLTKDGVKRARDIHVGDVIIDASGNEQILTYAHLGELLDGQIAINFELDISSQDPLERVIVADNIASGDLAVQNSKLPGEE